VRPCRRGRNLILSTVDPRRYPAPLAATTANRGD
jgi:hypothetical protein